MTGNPIVTMNRAVAAAMVDGPKAGLTLFARLDERLPVHHRLDAVRAHLLEMDGDIEAATANYRTAAGRTTSEAERHYLRTRAARVATRQSLTSFASAGAGLLSAIPRERNHTCPPGR